MRWIRLYKRPALLGFGFSNRIISVNHSFHFVIIGLGDILKIIVAISNYAVFWKLAVLCNNVPHAVVRKSDVFYRTALVVFVRGHDIFPVSVLFDTDEWLQRICDRWRSRNRYLRAEVASLCEVKKQNDSKQRHHKNYPASNFIVFQSIFLHFYNDKFTI